MPIEVALQDIARVFLNLSSQWFVGFRQQYPPRSQ
jgi:hypothetical protein